MDKHTATMNNASGIINYIYCHNTCILSRLATKVIGYKNIINNQIQKPIYHVCTYVLI